MALDPTFSLVLRFAFAALFAASATHKLRDFAAFRAAVAGYQLVPAPLVAPVALAIVAVELLSVMIFVADQTSLVLVPIGLLALYTLAITVNLRRGRVAIDCGCLGAAGRTRLHRGLVGRNLALLILALCTALPRAPRELLWIDYVSVVGAGCVLLALYGAIDSLLAQAARRQSRQPRPSHEALHA